MDIEQLQQSNIYTPNKITKNGSRSIYSRLMTFQCEILTLYVTYSLSDLVNHEMKLSKL